MSDTPADIEADEMMHRVRTVHVTFVEASEKACMTFGKLLDALDAGGTRDDADILKKHGRKVYDAYLKAERAFRELEVFF